MLSVPLGALHATVGILGALVERGRTGKGAQVDVSLAEASTWVLSGARAPFTADYKAIAASPDRRLYACADGRFISVAAAEPRTWGALVQALDLPELADKLGVRGAEAEPVTARLAGVFAGKPAAEWVALLGPLGAAVNAVHRGEDVLTDPQYVAREAFAMVAGEPVPANPVRLTDAQGRGPYTADAEPPLVGEHTEEVLGRAGFTPDEIAQLRHSGLV